MDYQQFNNALLPEYLQYHEELLQLFDAETKKTLSLPLLMHVFPEYDILEKKIMVVGQETKGWGGTLADRSKNLSQILGTYKKFELAKTYHGRNSPFWRFNRALFTSFNPNKNLNGLLWTNLSKVDQNGVRVNQAIRSKNKAGYDLLLKEIQIIQPQIIVFLTSYKQDEMLRSIFKGLSIQKVEGIHYNYLARLKSRDLPLNTFRTYHPRFLNNGIRSNYTINEMVELVHANCVN